MTHTAKHTPGPWFYNYDDRCITNQDGVTVINVHGAMSGDNTNADIAMLAAAPAMYEALQQSLVLVELAALEEWGREVRGEQQPPTTEARDRLEKVKTALAQAEGKQ